MFLQETKYLQIFIQYRLDNRLKDYTLFIKKKKKKKERL